MAKKNNRKCIICNCEYHYCPTCSEDSEKPTWYFIFHNKNCHDIYDVCTQYRDKEIDAEKANEILSSLDLSDIENFEETTRLQIEEIMKTKVTKNSKLEVDSIGEKQSNTNVIKKK